MSSMEHQEVDLSKPQNQDLIWDLDSMARRELAERFIQLFENRLCVYSESVSQLYTNYNLHFPSESGRKMVVLPNPYAFHDTLHGIDAVAVRKTGLCVLPGVVLGAICFAIFLGEGAVLDWSAVFLTEYRGLPNAQGGLGFACFAATMTLGRMTGDRVVARLGRHAVVVVGSLVATAGLLTAVFVPAWQASLFGYAFIGIGCANIVPVMFSAIGRQDSMPQIVAVPAVTTLGYLGILAGPAAIGFIAQHSGLPVAFLFVGVLFLAVAAASKTVRM